MNRFINLALLKHPVNWLIVWTVLMLAGFGWHIIHSAVVSTPSAPANDNGAVFPSNAAA